MRTQEQLSTFDVAVLAFQIRFERDLSSHCEDLEWKTRLAMEGASPATKRASLERFFDDVAETVGQAIHNYFPRMLQVAVFHRDRLGDQSPLAWTKAQMLTQSCNFLGMEQPFNYRSEPREDSLVLETTERITKGRGWFDNGSPSGFRLPAWVAARHPMDSLFRPFSSEKPLGSSDPESLSRADTLQWVKLKEFWIERKLHRQIEDDGWDALIEAGKSDVSVLEAIVEVLERHDGTESTGGPAVRQENSFVREAATWAITFGDETCRLQPLDGLEYLSVLLEYPGKAMSGLELQTLATGQPGDSSTARSDEGHLSQQELLDDRARQNVQRRLVDLEEEIAIRHEIGDMQKVNALEKEHAEIQTYFQRAQNVHARSRLFADDNEKARMSVSKALTRLFEKIWKQAPKTANHFKSNITTGSKFVYRDASTAWTVRRIR